mgnify:CR=1 FL=1
MTSVSPALLELLSKVLAGQASSEELSKRIEQERNGASDPNEAIESGRFRRIQGATVDLGRSSRCGFGEVIFGEEIGRAHV